MERKVLQYLEFDLYVNFITLFATIKDLYNHLEDIFGNFHWKKYAINMFQKLKMGTRLFNNFYSKFICLALDLEYIYEMLIQKFKHKLILHF